MDDKVRVWCIGSDGTEYFAAHSEEEMRQYYIDLMGTGGRDQAEDDLLNYFDEVPEEELDVEFNFNNDGTLERTTWRKLVAEEIDVPTQISTGYN